MFFPILIPCFFTPSRGLSGGSYVKSGDKYTTEWWQNELDCYYATKQKVAACLIMLERQGMVKKIKKVEFDVVKFKPKRPFSKSDVVEKLREKIFIKHLTNTINIAKGEKSPNKKKRGN